MLSIVASLSFLAAGINNGLSSTMIYSLEHGGTGEISTTLEDASWIRKNTHLSGN